MTTASPEFDPGRNDSELLLHTFRFYGSLSFVAFVVFCVARKKLPRLFNLRSWNDELQCQLATDCLEFGYVDWIWRVLRCSDSEIREQCGMDAICLLRMFKFGMKLCLVGMVNSIWLLPIYTTSDEFLWNNFNVTSSDALPSDSVARASVSALPPISHRLVAPVVASYLVFGFAMYFIFQEFAWFAHHRHAYLSEREPRNYCVYVSGIPPAYRTDAALADLFRRICGEGSVYGATVFRRIPKLQAKVSRRQQLLGQIERAQHIVRVERIEQAHYRAGLEVTSKNRPLGSMDKDEMAKALLKLAKLNCQIELDVEDVERHEPPESKRTQIRRQLRLSVVKSALQVNEGERKDAGFVYFFKRTARQAALRMVHSSEPYALNTLEAPDPENLFVTNVGKSHRQTNIGRLISIGLTMGLRIAWTFPTVFIASLANLEDLGQSWPLAEAAITKYPWLVDAGSTSAPLLLLILNSSLPIMLEWISLFELPLSQSSLIGSQFLKLASFMIIQTFFVTALSGSVWNVLGKLGRAVSDVGELRDFLGSALPGQSIFFIQLLLVKTFVGIPLQLLNVSPLLKAAVRHFVGPNLTREESSQIYLKVIRPLCKPLWLLHAEVASANVLYFMVFFVYSSTAPLVNWFLMFCFIALYPSWRYQIFCNYPTKPDTGGQIFVFFLRIVRASTIIGQLTLWAILALKRYPNAIAWMLPLLVANVIFNVYISRRHEMVANVLPSELSIAVDENESDNADFSFLKDAYKQKALLAKDPLLPKRWSTEDKDTYEAFLADLQPCKAIGSDRSLLEISESEI